MITDDDIKDILLESEYLNNQSANYRSYVQDLADFYLPRKAWITTIRTKGERTKFNFLYDSTGIRSLRTMASGFHTNLTNRSSRWYALETSDKKLMKDREVRQYFKEVEDQQFAVLEQSNFYNVINEFYMDFGGFGQGTYSMLEDTKEVVRFKEIPIGQVCRVVDANDRLCGIYNNFKLTARQAFKLWGPMAGNNVVDALEKKPFEEFDFLHFAGERYSRDVNKADSSNMPFKSVWLNKKEKKLISEGGFMEMPYISEVFYKDNSDPNGFAPTMDVFAEVKLVNAMQRTLIRASMKQADPPLVMPSRGFVLPLNFDPAAMNYRDAKTSHEDIQALPVGNGRIDVNVEMITLIQQKIEEGMFVPLFRALSQITKQMTIPEIQQRIAENMVLLSPVIGRCDHGVLSPTIVRLYNIMNRNFLLPQPPEILQGQNFQPVYLSPLAKAQRQTEINEVQAFLGEVQAIGAILPGAIQKLDEDKTVDYLHRVRGITPEIMRTDEDLQRVREEQAQQQQAMMAMQGAGGVAQISKTSAEAQKAGAEAEAAGKQ